MTRIFGYTFDQIQRAQHGGRLSEVIDTTKPSAPDGNLAADQALLAKHGMDGLKALSYFGVVDRLERAGVTTSSTSSGTNATIAANHQALGGSTCGA